MDDVSALSEARFQEELRTGRMVRRAFDKAVRRKPPVVAADAGPMQIQLWGSLVTNCAGTVHESTAAGRERRRRKILVKRKWKDAVGRTARHRKTERADTRESLAL